MALTNNEASIVLGMVARGDKEHDIAAWFGENQARIAEVKQGSHGAISAAGTTALPPKGAPGPKGRRLHGAVINSLDILKNKGTAGIDEAIEKLSAALDRYNKHEA